MLSLGEQAESYICSLFGVPSGVKSKDEEQKKTESVMVRLDERDRLLLDKIAAETGLAAAAVARAALKGVLAEYQKRGFFFSRPRLELLYSEAEPLDPAVNEGESNYHSPRAGGRKRGNKGATPPPGSEH